LTANELANQQTFQEFAYFLAKDAIKNIKAQIHKGEAVSEDHNGDPLAVSTAQQYFSNFLNAAANRFSDHVFFKEILDVPRGESLPWVKKIRDELRQVMERDLILDGIPITLKSRGVAESVMDNCIDYVIEGA